MAENQEPEKPPIEIPSCWCDCGKHYCAQHDCPCFMEQWLDDED